MFDITKAIKTNQSTLVLFPTLIAAKYHFIEDLRKHKSKDFTYHYIDHTIITKKAPITMIRYISARSYPSHYEGVRAIVHIPDIAAIPHHHLQLWLEFQRMQERYRVSA